MQPDTATKMIKKLLVFGGYSTTELAKHLKIPTSLMRKLRNGEQLSATIEQRLIKLYCKTNFIKNSMEY
jgi:hypothetical protein